MVYKAKTIDEKVQGIVDRARKASKDLRSWADELLALADGIMRHVRYSEDDHFGFMALCFIGKQVDHMKSILVLDESPDVVLIARSMIEGLCQLLWTVKDPCARGLQWRAYSYIQDWRVMEEKIAAGERVDRETHARIEEGIRLYGDQFLTSEARKKRTRGEPLPRDPYRKSWTGHQVRQICEEVKGELLYLHLYRPFSDYHHWSPSGLGIAVKRQQNEVVYSSRLPQRAAAALSTAFHCLLQTVEEVDKHLELEVAGRVVKLRDRFIAWDKAQHSS